YERRRRFWNPRKWLLVFCGALLLLVAPILARGQSAPVDSVALQWTAPGDDGAIGTATSYEMRMATLPITSGNWSMANTVAGMPAPLISGSRQSVVVRGLSRDTTYFFAIRTQDDNGNVAPISNV